MVIGIIGALNEEVNIIKNSMEHMQEQEILGNIFYKGRICNNIVVICECSIGKVNAAITTSALIIEFNPDLIINTGIAGSLKSNVKIMSLVIANKISLHDENEVFGKYYPFATSFCIKQDLVNMAKRFYTFNDKKNLHIGEIISGDIYLEDSNKKFELVSQFKNSLAVDMECGAIAKVCFRATKDLLVIKTISDEANDEANISYDNFINLAATKSAQLVLNILFKI